VEVVQYPVKLVWIPSGTATIALRQRQGEASVAIQTEQGSMMFKYFLYQLVNSRGA